MDKRDWLVLLLGFKGAGDSPALDPVRVQKGMFLVTQEVGLSDEERYDFEPYNWGPYSREVRNDLDRLVADGYVQTRDVPGYSWKRYGLTAAGIDYGRHILEDAPREAAHHVAEIKRRVTGVTFNRLLEDVYSDYPEYAVNSVFRS